MSIKSKDEILSALKEILNDDASDNAIAILEDVADTFDDFTTKTKTETDWKQKYEDNDKEWRQRYRDRFFNHSKDDPEDKMEDFSSDDIVDEKTKFEELFSQKGE